MGPKKLLRSNENKMICGVCGGIGEYFNMDPTLIRLLWVLLSLGSCGTGCWPILLPQLLFRKTIKMIPIKIRAAIKAPYLIESTLSAAPAYLHSPMLMQIFFRVARPPRICRSDLFTSKTFLACLARPGLICNRRSATSLCIVVVN